MIREERLIGYVWAVRKNLVPRPSENGTPDFVEETLLIFESQAGGHRIVIGLDDENRQRLVTGLTGGIVLPGT
jgi:hypothetical protein